MHYSTKLGSFTAQLIHTEESKEMSLGYEYAK